MSTLYAKINRSTKTATFWGPGTFGAKEAIKRLGTARWNGSEKKWEVSGFELSQEQLLELLPNTVIDDAEDEPIQAPSSSDSVESSSELPNSISVSELMNRVQVALLQTFPQSIFVRGVLSSVKETKNGYVFIDLDEEKDREETVRCVIWRDKNKISSKLEKAGFTLEADLQVMFEVRVSLAKKWGSLSLEIIDVVAEYTLAKLAAQRDQTNERLKKEKIFEQNKSLALPTLPRRLGILTSASGTVINDFRDSLDQAQFGFELFWYPVSVQGSEAKKEITAGIKFLEKLELDAILIFRGGGSAADLAVFNEYDVARAVCCCSLPVVSAIGHQEDQCSVQDVSCIALGVPKDIGRFFADIVIAARQGLRELSLNIRTSVGERMQLLQQAVAQLTKHLHMQAFHLIGNRIDISQRIAQVLISQADQCLLRASERYVLRVRSLKERLDREVERAGEKLKYLERIVSDSSPQVQLKRGFALVKSETEEFITRGEKLSEGALVAVEFYDTSKKAKIVT